MLFTPVASRLNRPALHSFERFLDDVVRASHSQPVQQDEKAYRLSFDVKSYFDAKGVALPEPRFLDQVHLDFGVAHIDQHYHVPLLVSPWSYSTYRGS